MPFWPAMPPTRTSRCWGGAVFLGRGGGQKSMITAGHPSTTIKRCRKSSGASSWVGGAMSAAGDGGARGGQIVTMDDAMSANDRSVGLEEHAAEAGIRPFLLLRYTLIVATAYLLLVEGGFKIPPVATMPLIVGALASNVV